MSFDATSFREQFPILNTEIYGKSLAYLDNAASVQKPQIVIDRINEVLTGGYANVHRGLHYLSNKATADYEKARDSVAKYLNAADRDEIVFTAGGTDAMNLVAQSLGVSQIGEGDEIILSVMEHHSNIVPWHLLRERKGAVIKWVDVDDDGHIDLDAYRALFTDRTKIVSITGLSNVLGVVPPIREMAAIAHERGVLFLTDGCQHAVHGPVDVQALGVDFYVLTGHKIYGPNGIGALYGRKDVLATMPPFKGGGEMIDTVSMDEVTYNDPPHRFEAGTPPITEAIALGAALDWMMEQDMDGLRAHERALTDHAMEALTGLNWINLYGRAKDKGPVIAFNLNGAHPHDVSTVLDRQGVAIRAGHHCCQPLMRRLGVTATGRASFAAYNTHEDIDQFVKALHKAQELFA
ncbi:cysteine desulfurase [Aquisalinus flavus]|uniref:Cysteine desulfurase n=1 Tax=Aquisalinus flavus TaxID=1526572 RepID=A0A8J2Y4T0_9PROT|nr:cysteine desulfurase [Aquisalinus flavus]MBD0427547.1 cysteine desulfurase [Aquisalinus flavus]GGD01818.1 cysteine desulfurase [Aquisalinus flavus]